MLTAYINNKIEFLNKSGDLDLLENLYNCLYKLIKENIVCIDCTDDCFNCPSSNDCIQSFDDVLYAGENSFFPGYSIPEKTFSSVTDDLALSQTKTGVYVHVINQYIDTNNIDEYIDNLMDIDGEICVSEFGDNQLQNRKSLIAIAIKGTPTKTFDCDCWSQTDKNGNRYATKYGFDGRNESWIVPKKSEIVAIISDLNIKTKHSLWNINI